MINEVKYRLIMPLLQKLNNIQVLGIELENVILNALEIITYRRRHVILKTGETASHIYVVLKGLARVYSFCNGKETTTRFIPEGGLIICPTSYFDREPGNETVELLEDSMLAALSFEQYEEIYSAFETFNYTGRKLAERYLVLAEKRTYLLQLTQPSKKFLLFTELHGALIGRVPDEHIASYLGMGRSTFNKMKTRYWASNYKNSQISINT
jgi:CRP/FNR family transcriptional regulator, anaerobic regulatory protein